MKCSTFFVYFVLLTGLKLQGDVKACNIADQKYVNHTAKIVNVETSTTEIAHSVGGSIKILSGCTFFVRNMTIIPTGNAVYWYGISSSNNTEGYPRIVPSALGSYNGQSIIFTLDPQYSFDDVAIMEIRSEGDGTTYGAFAVNSRVEEFYSINKGSTTKEDDPNDPTRPFDSNSLKNKIYGFERYVLFLGIFLIN